MADGVGLQSLFDAAVQQLPAHLRVDRPEKVSLAGQSQLAGAAPLAPDRPTRGFDEIALLLDTQQAQAGGRTNNERRGKFTFLTNYTFSQGMRHGFAVGGSVVWQSAPAIGYALKPLAVSNPVTYVSDSGKPYFGTPLMDVGASVSYSRKLFRNRITWKLQLNIRNLLDATDTYRIRMASVPAAPTTPLSQVSQLREPRSFVLTNTFSF